MKKPPIPSVPTGDRTRAGFDSAVKERLELLGGERNTKIKPLDPETATLSDIATKLNELIYLLQ